MYNTSGDRAEKCISGSVISNRSYGKSFLLLDDHFKASRPTMTQADIEKHEIKWTMKSWYEAFFFCPI